MGNLNNGTSHGNHESMEPLPIVLGFMGPPGIGKTVAMNIIEDHKNRILVTENLGWDRTLEVGVARKSTTRENRGADDRLKESNLSDQEFDAGNMIGEYTLSNNGKRYGYRESELNKPGADLLIAEPSLHHLEAINAYLRDRLQIVLLASSRQYRMDRLGGRGTENQAEVRRRVLEGDAQLIIAEMLKAPLKHTAMEWTDSTMVKIFTDIRDANSIDDARLHIDTLAEYLADFAKDPDQVTGKKLADKAAQSFAEEIHHLPHANGHTLIDHVLEVDESYLSRDPLRRGKYRYKLLQTVGDILVDREPVEIPTDKAATNGEHVLITA